MGIANVKPCGFLDNGRRLWRERMCLEPVSKNLGGELKLFRRDRQECEDPKCATYKTVHNLNLAVQSHLPCDSAIGQLLDGQFFVPNLVHALISSGLGRGTHTGEFEWQGSDVFVVGEISGMTNVGTHRQPIFDPCQGSNDSCQVCNDRGYMEGRLCGRIVEAEDPKLVGCRVVGAYRFRFQPSEVFNDTPIQGTFEGLIVCPCDSGKCIDFTGFPAGSHQNPWTIGDCTFDVRDHDGNPQSTADVVTWGGFTGLNAGFDTKITMATPVTRVDITLINFSTPATVAAYDSSAQMVDSATMTAAGAPETLHLSGTDITTVVVTSPQNETLILEYCVST